MNVKNQVQIDRGFVTMGSKTQFSICTQFNPYAAGLFLHTATPVNKFKKAYINLNYPPETILPHYVLSTGTNGPIHKAQN